MSSSETTNVEELVKEKNILLFDGECIMCDGTVKFILERDPEAKISFAPLQSEIGENILCHYDIPMDMDTVVFVENGESHLRSTAILHALSHLTPPWSYFSSPLLFIPAIIRDTVYRFVARYRYLIFGKQEMCSRPTSSLKDRFLAF